MIIDFAVNCVKDQENRLNIYTQHFTKCQEIIAQHRLRLSSRLMSSHVQHQIMFMFWFFTTNWAFKFWFNATFETFVSIQAMRSGIWITTSFACICAARYWCGIRFMIGPINWHTTELDFTWCRWWTIARQCWWCSCSSGCNQWIG